MKNKIILTTIFFLILIIAALVVQLVIGHQIILSQKEVLIPYQTKKMLNSKEYLFIADKYISYKDINYCYAHDVDPVFAFFPETLQFEENGFSLEDGDYYISWSNQTKDGITYNLYATQKAIDSIH